MISEDGETVGRSPFGKKNHSALNMLGLRSLLDVHVKKVFAEGAVVEFGNHELKATSLGTNPTKYGVYNQELKAPHSFYYVVALSFCRECWEGAREEK